MAADYAVELAESVKHARNIVRSNDLLLAIVAPRGLGDECPELVGELTATACPTIVVADERQRFDALERSVIAAAGDGAHIMTSVSERALLPRISDIVDRRRDQSGERGRAPELLYFEGLTLDLAGHALHGRDGEDLPLTPAEFALLATFARHPGRALSRGQLGYAIPGHTAEADDRSIDIMIWRLRRKIEVNPKAPSLILTVPGAGYKFTTAVRPANARVAQLNGASRHDSPAARARSVERRHLTVLSCDLAEWAELSRLDAEDAHTSLAAFRRCATEVVVRFGGIVGGFSGCEMQAYFGYPGANEHDAERAVRAAVGIVEAVSRLDWAFPALRPRSGVSTGLVMIGNTAEERRMHAPSAVGEAPLVASRLRSLATPDTVLIGTNTYDLVSGLFRCRQLERPADTEASDWVPAWQVVGESAAGSRFEALHRGRPRSLMVGRDEEGDFLLRRWRQSTAGEGRVVLISGEAGIGKSRLASWLCDRIATEPHTRLRFQCSPYHRDSTLHPITARLLRLAGIGPGQTPEHQADELEKMLAVAASDPVSVAPLFASLLSIPTGQRYPPLTLAPEQLRRQTLAALISQFESLARREPLLLLLEDAQWADATSLELLDLTIGLVPSLPALVIVTFRSEFVPTWAGLSNVSALALSRLEPRHVQMMIAGIPGGQELPRDAVEEIVARTDGIPLFVEELTKSIVESRRLAAAEEGNGTSRTSLQVSIPASLQSSLMARLDRRASAKEIAQIGAVIGRRFSYALLRCVAPQGEAALRAALDELEHSELVIRRGVWPDATYIFKHALVQDAAYDTLPKTWRRAIHRLIAEALRDKFPTLAETEPEVVAHHFARAGIADAALNWFSLAAQRAVSRSAYVEAIAHFSKAVDIGDESLTGVEHGPVRLRLQINYANAMIAARGHGALETTAAFARARELATDCGNSADRLSIYYGLWVGSFVRGELGPLRDLSAAFLREAGQRRLSPEAGIAQRLVGVTAWLAGDYSRALESLEAAVSAYDRMRDHGFQFQFGQDAGVTAMIYLAFALWPMGRTRDACHVIEAAHALAVRSEHPLTIVFSHSHAATFACLRGDAADAARHAAAATEMSRKYGMAMWVPVGAFCSGWARGRSGQQAEGLAAMREAWPLLPRPGTFSPFYAWLLAAAEGEEHFEAGLARLEDHIREAEQRERRWFDAELHRLHGRLLARRDTENPAVEAAFLRSVEIAKSQGARTFELRAAVELAKLYQSSGRADAAVPLLEPIHRASMHESDVPEVGEASNILNTAAR